MNIQSIKYRLTKGITVIGCCLLAIGQQGCSDFLDLKPLNEVVLENYWTKKDDVTSVLMGCYDKLSSEDCITRMGLWGEARSDNMIMNTSASSRDLENFIKENILPSNSYCTWTVFYETINRCNLMIHYAPMVQEMDPNYTLSEMKANIAEATFIRSLCYFYLIRTFRDVPFTREPSIDDTQNYQVPADSFDVVLNNLIEDLEAVKNDAQLYFRKPDPDKVQGVDEAELNNTARVTRPAIYALLADLYLWQGNWEKCVECCDYIIDFKQNEHENLKRRLQNDVALFNDIPLIKEKRDGDVAGNAYYRIFCQGNSFESLFELTFRENREYNNFIGGFYAYRSDAGNDVLNGLLAPYDEFYGELPQKANDLFTSVNDYRAYESIYHPINSMSYYIAKYALYSIDIKGSGSNLTITPDWRTSGSASERRYTSANWIVYRLTDVLLMKAEALVQQGSDQFEEAFSLVNAVSKRAVNSLSPGTGEILKFDDYKSSKEDMEQLVFDERHRELMFEGKRWFDLLRQARRTGSTRTLAITVTKKQTTNVSGIQIRLADPNALYLPYSRNELKVNPYLKQNPAYRTGDDSDLEKN